MTDLQRAKGELRRMKDKVKEMKQQKLHEPCRKCIYFNNVNVMGRTDVGVQKHAWIAVETYKDYCRVIEGLAKHIKQYSREKI